MSGSADNAVMRVALVIGIHHRELEYGQKVADLLIDSNIQMLRIDEGLPQQMEFDGKSFYYSTYLREIYLQVHQQIHNNYDLLIDLHTGINEAKRCADMYCSDIRLLDTVQELLAKMTRKRGSRIAGRSIVSKSLIKIPEIRKDENLLSVIPPFPGESGQRTNTPMSALKSICRIPAKEKRPTGAMDST